jgi:hypothetical protein
MEFRLADCSTRPERARSGVAAARGGCSSKTQSLLSSPPRTPDMQRTSFPGSYRCRDRDSSPRPRAEAEQAAVDVLPTSASRPSRPAKPNDLMSAPGDAGNAPPRPAWARSRRSCDAARMSASPPKPDLDGPDSKVREGPEPGGLRLNVAVGREAVLDHSRRAEFGRPRPQPRRAPGGSCAASRLATRSSPPDRQRPTGDTGDGAPPHRGAEGAWRGAGAASRSGAKAMPLGGPGRTQGGKDGQPGRCGWCRRRSQRSERSRRSERSDPAARVRSTSERWNAGTPGTLPAPSRHDRPGGPGRARSSGVASPARVTAEVARWACSIPRTLRAGRGRRRDPRTGWRPGSLRACRLAAAG